MEGKEGCPLSHVWQPQTLLNPHANLKRGQVERSGSEGEEGVELTPLLFDSNSLFGVPPHSYVSLNQPHGCPRNEMREGGKIHAFLSLELAPMFNA